MTQNLASGLDGTRAALDQGGPVALEQGGKAASEHPPAAPSAGNVATELASRRTGMSFQRTRMSADRTLMSVIRTALSLIGFGFTIFQFFQKLKQASVISSAHSARNFGATLVFLGIGMLTLGIAYHLLFMNGLRKTREEMTRDGLIHGQSQFPPSLTLITAVVLLAIGVAAVSSMLFDVGPLEL